MLYAAALREQADGISLQTCDSAAEEPEDFATAAKLFQKAAGVLLYIDAHLLAAERPLTSGKCGLLCTGHGTSIFESWAKELVKEHRVFAFSASWLLGQSVLRMKSSATLKPICALPTLKYALAVAIGTMHVTIRKCE